MDASSTTQILQLITRENLRSYNFQNRIKVDYDAVKMWNAFDKINTQIAGGYTGTAPEQFLTTKERILYMKGLTVAVVKAIEKKFYKLPDHGKGEFQRDYLASTIVLLKRYYERQLYKTIFKEFPRAPKTTVEKANFKGYLVTKAKMILSSKRRDGYRTALKEEGIDYQAYVEAWIKALPTGTQDLVSPKDFRNPAAVAVISASLDEVEQFCQATFYIPEYNLDEHLEYLEPVPGMVTDAGSIKIEEIARRFGLYDAGAMRSLYQHFENDRVEEVSAAKLWTVRYYQLDMSLVWKIYNAMSHGASLSKDGKEFLLMQFLMIALDVYHERRGFQKDESIQAALLNRDQMMLLTKLISDGFVYFLGSGEEKIVQPWQSTDREEIFKAIRAYFSDRYYKLWKAEATKTALPLAMVRNESAKEIPATQVDLQETLGKFEVFESLIAQIQIRLSVDDLLDDGDSLRELIARVMADGSYADLFRPFLKACGYKVLEESPFPDAIAFEGHISRLRAQVNLSERSPFKSVKRIAVVTKDHLSAEQVTEIDAKARKHRSKRTTIIAAGGFDTDIAEKLGNREAWIERLDLDGLATAIQTAIPDMDPEKLAEFQDAVVSSLMGV